MIYFTIVFFCIAGMFLALLEDRFRMWTTLCGMAAAYLLALVLALALRRSADSPTMAEQVPCGLGCAIFFLVSLFLFRNNFLQKLFLALLSLCNFAFLGFFIPLLLGAMPFSTAGAFAGMFSVLGYFLFTLVITLCLYHPYHHFSDRGPSWFLIGMCFVVIGLYALCLGKVDFLFRTNIFAARLLAAALVYVAMIFGFRSVYQAGRFRAKASAEAARRGLMDREAVGFGDSLTALRAIRASQKAGEYALDTVNVMLADHCADKIPEYVAAAKQNARKDPVLEHYHDHPGVNAVIAMKAALAAQNQIAFECNAGGESPLEIEELCVIISEMLTRACRDAAAFDGPRRIRFTVAPSERSLRFEAVYTGNLPKKEKFTLKGKRLADVLRWLLEDDPHAADELRGLDNTGNIVSRYSGKLTVSGTPGEVILQATLRF